MILTLVPAAGVNVLASTRVVNKDLEQEQNAAKTDTDPKNKRREDARANVTAEGSVDTSSVGLYVLVAYMFYMLVFHSLSNMPMNEGLLFGVQVRVLMPLKNNNSGHYNKLPTTFNADAVLATAQYHCIRVVWCGTFSRIKVYSQCSPN